MITPNVLKETCEGTACIPLRDMLFQRREVYLYGEITQESAHAVIMQLRYLSLADPETEITLYIDSPGGEADSGLAIYDMMQAISSPVRTVCTGTAASMAAILFAAGDYREMLKHSHIMIHDPLIPGGVGGTALKIDQAAKNIMGLRKTLAEILAKHTGHTVREVYEKTATDYYFDACEAFAWGLSDGEINSQKEGQNGK